MPSNHWHDFGNGCYALTGGSNIGFVAREGNALMVDAGLDADSARKAFRHLEILGTALRAVIVTHGHADHFGGAGWVAEHANVPVFAPPLEGTLAEHPLLEPLFLYGGADPIEELRGKFTLAHQGTGPCRTLTPGPATIADIPIEVVALPGHAPNQMGIAFRGDEGATLFCGDAVFPEATLQRHPILFCADLDAWLETLRRLPDLAYTHFVAGHGDPMEDIRPAAASTGARLLEIRQVTLEALSEPREPYGILRQVAAHFNVTFAAPQFLLLSLTTIQAALTSLQRAGEAEIIMEDNHLYWRAISGA
jgi:glyoxylase-like metal-dependent hydrolase (beta-lactamase superfamily II)